MKKQTALKHAGSFQRAVACIDPEYAKFEGLKTLQLNLGDVCNLKCFHCHVNASPRGVRTMGRDVMDVIIKFLSRNSRITIDLTGGSPEMNPHFRYLLERTEGIAGKRIVRTNLAVLEEPGMDWLPEFLRDQRVSLVASLPCFTEEEVDRQRGTGVFARSISVLKKLNGLGYGRELELNLAHNPGGDFLPGAQTELEAVYRRELQGGHGIIFNRLYVLANSPSGRFRVFLDAQETMETYFRLLETSFNRDTAQNIMCRTLVSVNWEGKLFCCDFNQALGIPIRGEKGGILTVRDLDEAAGPGRRIDLDRHCFSCTAGEGSSCTGALKI